MYTIYLDKSENFECNLQLEGASLKKSICRLIIESPEITVLCNGTINSDGSVSIPIQKLKNIIEDGSSGNLQLEVIADGDTFFVPWQETFEAKLSKKVTVEVKSGSGKSNIIQEKVTSKPSAKISFSSESSKSQKLSKQQIVECVSEFGKVIVKNDITLNNLKSKNLILAECFGTLSKKYTIEKNDRETIIENVIKLIEKRNN